MDRVVGLPYGGQGYPSGGQHSLVQRLVRDFIVAMAGAVVRARSGDAGDALGDRIIEGLQTQIAKRGAAEAALDEDHRAINVQLSRGIHGQSRLLLVTRFAWSAA